MPSIFACYQKNQPPFSCELGGFGKITLNRFHFQDAEHPNFVVLLPYASFQQMMTSMVTREAHYTHRNKDHNRYFEQLAPRML